LFESSFEFAAYTLIVNYAMHDHLASPFCSRRGEPYVVTKNTDILRKLRPAQDHPTRLSHFRGMRSCYTPSILTAHAQDYCLFDRNAVAEDFHRRNRILIVFTTVKRIKLNYSIRDKESTALQ
jgi:hypothetical protein